MHNVQSLTPRKYRVLSNPEKRVRSWIALHPGVLSNLAREFKLSVSFVQRIAYNREASSQGLRVEKRLKSMGCPLQQEIR